jgi:hypothetical protein
VTAETVDLVSGLVFIVWGYTVVRSDGLGHVVGRSWPDRHRSSSGLRLESLLTAVSKIEVGFGKRHPSRSPAGHRVHEVWLVSRGWTEVPGWPGLSGADWRRAAVVGRGTKKCYSQGTAFMLLPLARNISKRGWKRTKMARCCCFSVVARERLCASHADRFDAWHSWVPTAIDRRSNSATLAGTAFPAPGWGPSPGPLVPL